MKFLGKTPSQHHHVGFTSQPSLILLLLQFRRVRTFQGSRSYKIYVISGREVRREWGLDAMDCLDLAVNQAFRQNGES